MNYINESIELLENYKMLKGSIKSMESELAYLNIELNEMGYKPINYNGMPHGNYKIPDDEICNRIVRRDKKERALKETKAKVERIDLILTKLDSEEKDVLIAKFIHGKSYEVISDELHLSFASITRRKNDGLKNLSLQLWGIMPLM